MIKNSKSSNKTKSSKGQFGDGYYTKHKGKHLHETEHHDRMGHVVGKDEAYPSVDGVSNQ